MERVIARVPATTANLGPGFDALGMSLDLWNEFEFTADTGNVVRSADEAEVTVACEGEGAGELPEGRDNLVFKSFVKAFEPGDVPARVQIVVRNRVPLSSGLGSSATAIVGGLAAGLKLRTGELPLDLLIDLASRLEGHPDNVAPATLGGLVTSAVRRDGSVEALSVRPPESLWVCLAVPDFYLRTERARERLPERISREDAVFNLSRAALWIAACATGRLDVLRTATEDVLHQPYRRELIPGLDEVFQAATECGAYGVALSGSGPSVAAFCARERGEAIGEAMRVAFRKVGVTARIILTRPSTRGVQVSAAAVALGDVGGQANA